ncbi:MAG: serine/threonine dehydratase [Gammaproteobacteria bacterium]|nr:MAG: serine/threonine dehydratase [Gammaproteobacteria bacterium]
MDALSLENIRCAAERLAPYVDPTPLVRCYEKRVIDAVGSDMLTLKLEFLQRTGSFKVRGAINNILTRPDSERGKGVTAVSAGNHAIAVAYAAQVLGVPAKVLMPGKASPVRIEKCRRYGAEVVFFDDIGEGFGKMNTIAIAEERTIVHPFDGMATLQGTATVGLEIGDALDDIDVIVVAVGGGGLIGGVGAALKSMKPGIQVIGVEPKGACGMSQSLERGEPLGSVVVNTIADSMGAPLHCAESFAVCQRVIDRIVLVDDDALCQAMALIYDTFRFALEPAGVSVIAALTGPLADSLRDQRIAALLCGSNIDEPSWCNLVQRGRNGA